MANQRNTNRRRPASSSGSRNRNSRQGSQRHPSRRRAPKKSGINLGKLLSFSAKSDFKPDTDDAGLLKKLYLTQVQRCTLLKWGLYIAVIVGLCMIQDVIMSQITIFGATTDLAVCAILLITVIEGIDVGSIFVIIASCLFYFSGSSPGPLSVGIMTFLGIGACLFRQMYWHRSRGSIVLCAGLALILYELGMFTVGVFSNLTRWDRLGIFLTTGVLSALVMIPLYSLINVIGQIGGNTWKE